MGRTRTPCAISARRQKELRIYTREDGGSWQEADCGTMGSYLTFSTSGDSVEFAAVRTLDVWGIWLGVLAVLAVLILIIVLLVHRHKRKARRRAEALARSASAVSQAEQIVRGRGRQCVHSRRSPCQDGCPRVYSGRRCHSGGCACVRYGSPRRRGSSSDRCAGRHRRGRGRRKRSHFRTRSRSRSRLHRGAPCARGRGTSASSRGARGTRKRAHAASSTARAEKAQAPAASSLFSSRF